MEPAVHHVSTRKKWTDLTLDNASREQIAELQHQLKDFYGVTPDKLNRRQIGLAVLFSGPSKAERETAAALLGQESGLEVYRINLTEIVSKYIGETEKNIDQVFARSKDRKWILFFDEADALFGKRTETKDGKDRHANAELNYLLQRVQDYNGLSIIATNMKANIDDAFLRRLRFIIEFPFPG